MRSRVSIARLMGFVLLAGVGFAALKHPSDLWASALFTLAAGVLCMVALGAVFGQGRKRMSRAGFAVFGWAYLALAYLTTPLAFPQILPNKLLTHLQARINPQESVLAATYGYTTLTTGQPVTTGQPGVLDFYPVPVNQTGWTFPAWSAAPILLTPNSTAFFQIGHALSSMLAGLLGGLLVRVYARRDGESSSPVADGGST